MVRGSELVVTPEQGDHDLTLAGEHIRLWMSLIVGCVPYVGCFDVAIGRRGMAVSDICRGLLPLP
jgi:hypothetical protein